MLNQAFARRALLLRGAAFLSLAALPAAPALAQAGAFPTKPIRLIVTTAAGGASDAGARIVAGHLGTLLGQPVVVDNKPGAHGQIAAQAAKAAEKDGHTLLFSSTGPMAVNPSLYGKRLPYDPLKDFVAIAPYAAGTLYLVVNKDVPVADFRQLQAYAKANPGNASYGSAGSGSTAHLSMELLKKATGMELTHVPYRGSAALMQDLMGGRLPFALETAQVLAPLAKAGNVRVIGVGGSKRSAAFPNVPTLIEQGVPNFETPVWSGLFAPAGTPPEVVAKLNAVMNQIVKMPEVATMLRNQGDEPVGGSVEAFAQFLEREIARWAVAVKVSGATPD